MKEERIEIKLPNGDSLVAEACPYDGAQFAVGVVHDGVWIQDLAVVETDVEKKDEFNVYVYGSEYDECYTECFSIKRVPEEALK